MMPSLLAHLAFKFTSRHEDLATAALAYILKSERARGAFINYLNSRFDVQLPNNVTFHAQRPLPNNTIPDLVGVDEHDNRVVIVEAKFWAGLTDNQPNAYLRNLPDNTTGLLVFIAPTARVQDLWQDILSRCDVESSHVPCACVVQVDTHRYLGITTWCEVIDAIHRDPAVAQEEHTIADVLQLRGLCERLESEQFQPISEDELSPRIGLRITQYRDIIDTIVDQLRHTHVADTDGLRATTAGFSWGRSFRLNRRNICDLVFRPDAWARCERARTPLWLVVRPHQDQTTHALETVLQQLKLPTPEPLIARDENGQLLVPIFVPTGVDRNQVIKRVIEQICDVAGLLRDRTNEAARRNAQEPAAPCQPSD